MKRRLYFLSSPLNLVGKIVFILVIVLFTYLGYSISFIHSIGIFLVLNFIFAIGLVYGSAPFVFVYKDYICSFGESLFMFSRKKINQPLRIEDAYNSFKVITADHHSYKVKDSYSYLIPFGFVRRDKRKESLKSKIKASGLTVFIE